MAPVFSNVRTVPAELSRQSVARGLRDLSLCVTKEVNIATNCRYSPAERYWKLAQFQTDAI